MNKNEFTKKLFEVMHRQLRCGAIASETTALQFMRELVDHFDADEIAAVELLERLEAAADKANGVQS